MENLLELKTPYKHSYSDTEYYETLTFHPIDNENRIYLCIDKTEDMGMDIAKGYDLSIEESKKIIDFLQVQISKNK